MYVANCMVPYVHVNIMFSYPGVGPNGWQSLNGDVAFLDFFSHHVSIKHADTVTGFKGLDGIRAGPDIFEARGEVTK